MSSIQPISTTALRFTVPASVVPAAGLGAVSREVATTGGHVEWTGASIAALVERIPCGGVDGSFAADARPRTSVCRRSDR